MNAINRIELAIRRAASQMPDAIAEPFLLVASELVRVAHDAELADQTGVLHDYREHQ